MLYRLIDLEYSARLGRIDDEPLQRLLHGHEVLAVSERLYYEEGRPHVLVGVRYRLARPAPPRPATPADRGAALPAAGGSDWRSLLGEADWPLFERLRAWRSARARDEAVPPYVVLTNQQLAEVVRKRPRTLEALDRVPGFGKSRRERFGRELLEVIATGVVPSSGAEDQPVEEPAAKTVESPSGATDTGGAR